MDKIFSTSRPDLGPNPQRLLDLEPVQTTLPSIQRQETAIRGDSEEEETGKEGKDPDKVKYDPIPLGLGHLF